MDIRNKVAWLRISYWSGAIIDGFVAVQMLLPDAWAAFNDLAAHHPGPELSFALGAGASLMLGWTILLIWADRKPLERKGVLPITVLPVIAGLVLNNVISITAGLRTLESALSVFIIQSMLVALFIFSYWNAGDKKI